MPEETQIIECDLHTKIKTGRNKGKLLAHDSILTVSPSTIEFTKAVFALKDEIKSMAGSHWCGYDAEPKKVWTISNCQRNWFQLRWLMNDNPYEWFERDLVEHDYRSFPVKDEVWDLRDHQRLMADTGLTYHYQIWGAEMGVGKGGRLSTTVLTPSGWTTMGQLEIGTKIIDPSGGSCSVTGIYPRGKMEMFRVTFTDGTSTVCSADHWWRVITPLRKWRGQDYQVRTLQDLVDSKLSHVNGNLKWYIPMVEPVEFEERQVEIHPYVMGYLLGNGCLPYNQVTAPDQETVDRLNSLMTLPLKQHKSNPIDYSIQCPIVKQAIRDYDLKEHRSPTKFVPEDYLFNTVENRLALLQGLLDSDGYPLETSGIEFSSASEQLADAVIFLVQSMGGTHHKALKEEPVYTYKGERFIGRPSHRVTGSFSSQIMPFLLSRKAEKYTVPTKYQPTRAIQDVTSIGEEECLCIKVDSSTSCYVVEDFIVTHNTLSAQMVMENSGAKDWFWVGPLKSMDNIQIELEKFGFPFEDFNFNMTTYERILKFMRNRQADDPIPQGIILDESSRVKSPTAQQSKATQDLCDMIRTEYGMDGYVILMSGTPSPKSPLDWWKQCEVCWPGFLKEGSQKALERRLAFLVDGESMDGTIYKSRTGWKDDAEKCDTCGEYKDHANHVIDIKDPYPREIHKWEPSINEVAFMYERLHGLVTILHKKDVLDLPDKIYEVDICQPSPSTLRAAQALMEAAPNVITGMTWLRELSDGFMYKRVPDGKVKCPICVESDEEHAGQVEEWFDPEDPEQGFDQIDFFDDEYIAKLEKRWVTCRNCDGKQLVIKYKKTVREVKCPKEDKLVARLEECEETGRIIVFAGFQGSVDRIQSICHKNHWDVVRCDGRGWHVTTADGKLVRTKKPLHYWMDLEKNKRVAFVAHPMSGGLSLNLVESRMAVFWSNDFNPQSRSQAEDRIHRMGADENIGVKIVDFVHLPSDTHVREILKDNRRLELLTMGQFQDIQQEMTT